MPTTIREVAVPEVPLHFMSPLLGGDPEGFLVDENGTVIAPSTSLCGKERITPDGAQLELHPSAHSCRAAYADDCRDLLLTATTIAENLKCKFLLTPAIRVSTKNRQQFPLAANVFGCEPDWCAYKLLERRNPQDASRHGRRYGGFHIHVGCFPLSPYILSYTTKETLDQYKTVIDHYPAIIRVTDVLAGVASVALGIDPVGSRQRRKLFGQAGCFRVQPHGYEYRVLDNSLLRHPKLVYMFTGLVRDAYYIYQQQPPLVRYLLSKASQARDIINENDVDHALALWEEIAPEIERHNPANVPPSLDSATGMSERCWATQLVKKVREVITPEVAGSAEPHRSWQLADKVKTYQRAGFGHGGFCGGGIEPLLAAGPST